MRGAPRKRTDCHAGGRCARKESVRAAPRAAVVRQENVEHGERAQRSKCGLIARGEKCWLRRYSVRQYRPSRFIRSSASFGPHVPDW